MATKFKMAGFLLDSGHGTKRIFCSSVQDTHAYQISSIYVKRTGGTPL